MDFNVSCNCLARILPRILSSTFNKLSGCQEFGYKGSFPGLSSKGMMLCLAVRCHDSVETISVNSLNKRLLSFGQKTL